MTTKGIQLIEEEAAAVELQHINVKLLLKDPERVDLHASVPVFHSWIQEQSTDELLLDVASYAHVQNGPGVILIGHEADFSLDLTDGRLGLRYNRKAVADGNNQSRLEQAAASALQALQRLQSDERLGNSIQFDGRNIELFINDRLLAPNSQQTRLAADAEHRLFLRRLLSAEPYSLSYECDPRKLFGVRVQFEREFTVSDLLQNLR